MYIESEVRFCLLLVHHLFVMLEGLYAFLRPFTLKLTFTITIFRLALSAYSPYVLYYSPLLHGVWVGSGLRKICYKWYTTSYSITYLSQYYNTHTSWETQPPPVGDV